MKWMNFGIILLVCLELYDLFGLSIVVVIGVENYKFREHMFLGNYLFVDVVNLAGVCEDFEFASFNKIMKVFVIIPGNSVLGSVV